MVVRMRSNYNVLRDLVLYSPTSEMNIETDNNSYNQEIISGLFLQILLQF